MSSLIKITCNVFNFRQKCRLVVNVVSVYKRELNSTTNTNDNVTEAQDITQEREQEIEKIRNKSRLKPQHRNILFNKRPYSEPMTEAHLTVKYNRKLYGKYGSESGVNPGIMWPTKADLEMRREYEQIAFPHTIQEMVSEAKKELEMKELQIDQRQERIIANLAKLDTWKKELKDKLAKKEAEALAVKEKKEKLIEDVRRHFGFTVDPREDRFKELLAVKEKEQRKIDKQARIEEREKKAVAKLMEKHKTDFSTSDRPTASDSS